MVRTKVMRKKMMMVVPRGQDMEEMSLVEETGVFLIRSACGEFVAG